MTTEPTKWAHITLVRINDLRRLLERERRGELLTLSDPALLDAAEELLREHRWNFSSSARDVGNIVELCR